MGKTEGKNEQRSEKKRRNRRERVIGKGTGKSDKRFRVYGRGRCSLYSK